MAEVYEPITDAQPSDSKASAENDAHSNAIDLETDNDKASDTKDKVAYRASILNCVYIWSRNALDRYDIVLSRRAQSLRAL
jgi:hypothetical protein